MKAQRNQRALGKWQGTEKSAGRWGKTTGRWIKRQGAAHMCRNIRMRHENIQQNGVAKAKPAHQSTFAWRRYFDSLIILQCQVFIRQPSLFLMIMQAARGAGARKALFVFFFFLLLLFVPVPSHSEGKREELLCHVGFNSQEAHVEESPTYRTSEVGISPRSKQPLHSCTIISLCSPQEFPYTGLWETIKLLRGHHGDAMGCDAPRWASGCGANSLAFSSNDREEDWEKVLRCRRIQAKQGPFVQVWLRAAPFFAESTTILDILAHFDILLMLLTVFKYSNLVFTKYLLAIYVHEM